MKKRLILVCASLIFAMATAVSLEAFADKTTLQDPGTGGGGIVCDSQWEGRPNAQCYLPRVTALGAPRDCRITGVQTDFCP